MRPKRELGGIQACLGQGLACREQGEVGVPVLPLESAGSPSAAEPGTRWAMPANLALELGGPDIGERAERLQVPLVNTGRDSATEAPALDTRPAPAMKTRRFMPASRDAEPPRS